MVNYIPLHLLSFLSILKSLLLVNLFIMAYHIMKLCIMACLAYEQIILNCRQQACIRIYRIKHTKLNKLISDKLISVVTETYLYLLWMPKCGHMYHFAIHNSWSIHIQISSSEMSPLCIQICYLYQLFTMLVYCDILFEWAFLTLISWVNFRKFWLHILMYWCFWIQLSISKAVLVYFCSIQENILNPVWYCYSCNWIACWFDLIIKSVWK